MIHIQNIKTLILLFTFTIITKSFSQNENNITFVQGNDSFLISKNTDSITLERKAFSIRYFGKAYDEKNEKFYAAQIAVVENLSGTNNLKVGQNSNDIPYFEPGTGMAPGANDMYDEIIITNEGHHYLTYENESEKRVYLLSKTKDNLELEWKISSVYYKETDLQFSELKLASLYFVIFIDRNLNDIIDNEELKIVKVNFK